MRRTANSSLTNALRMLKQFSIHHPERTLSELQEAVGVSKSTASRLIQTLQSEGFIYHHRHFRTYRLGASVLSLSNTAINQFAWLKETTPFLKQLTEMTGESSHIAILDRQEVVYLKKEDSPNPAHCTASGQAILAYLDPAYIEQLFAHGLKPVTRHTIVSISELQRRLAAVRQQGVSVSKGEFLEHIISVGAPIFNKHNQVFASVSVAGPVKRMQSHLQRIISAVRLAGQKITALMQHQAKDVRIDELIQR